MRSSITILVAALVISSCGDTEKNKKAQPDLSVALDPSTVNVGAGQSATSTLHITRRGPLLGAGVTVTYDAPPAGITVTIAEAQDSDSTSVSVAVDASVQPQTVNLAVTATANTTTASDVLTIIVGLPTSVSLAGSVVSEYLLPFPNTPVTVWSHGSATPSQVNTADDGTFALNNVMPPYDVLVTSGGARTLYLGLTRVDPMLVVQLGEDPPVTTTSVSGTIGGSVGTDAKAYSIDCGTAAALSLQDAVTFDALLVGSLSSPSQCTAQMLRFSEQTGAPGPSEYRASGATFINVAPGTGASDVMIPVDDISIGTHTVAVHAATIDGLAVGAITPLWLPSVHTALPLNGTSTNGAIDFSVVLPTDSSVRVVLALTGEAADGTGSVTTHKQASATTNALNVTLPASPFIVAPEDLAVNVDESAQFTVSGGKAPTYVFQFGAGGGAAYDLAVVSALTALPANVLSAHGIPLQRGSDYHWQVTAHYGLTADQFATSASSLHDLYRSDGSLVGATSTQRFHTAP
jgi:hypothetical protein